MGQGAGESGIAMPLGSRERLDETLDELIEVTRHQLDLYTLIGAPDAARRTLEALRDAIGERQAARIAELGAEFSIELGARH